MGSSLLILELLLLLLLLPMLANDGVISFGGWAGDAARIANVVEVVAFAETAAAANAGDGVDIDIGVGNE